jgi:hypothetical protein
MNNQETTTADVFGALMDAVNSGAVSKREARPNLISITHACGHTVVHPVMDANGKFINQYQEERKQCLPCFVGKQMPDLANKIYGAFGVPSEMLGG